MKRVWLLLLLGACSAPPPPPTPPELPEAEGAAGGPDAAEVGVGATKLTGLPGIDRAQDLTARIIDARGTGRLGGTSIAAGSNLPLPPGQWMVTDPGSEYEITVRNALVPDGIVRLDSGAAFLIEAAPLAPRFHLYAGRASFYLPHVSMDSVAVITPVGPLVTRGGVFSVSISPDAQVLVTCRQGAVFLTGRQNAAAVPGQVLVADGIGRGRSYAMTPGESLTFADHWMIITKEESRPYFRAALSDQLTRWSQSQGNVEARRALAYWFRGARAALGTIVPGPEVWEEALTAPINSSWPALTLGPGLIGELP